MENNIDEQGLHVIERGDVLPALRAHVAHVPFQQKRSPRELLLVLAQRVMLFHISATQCEPQSGCKSNASQQMQSGRMSWGGERTRRRSRPACAWWREQASLARIDAAQTCRLQSNTISRCKRNERAALHGDDVVDVGLEQPAVEAEARGVLEDDDFRDEGCQWLGARHIAALSLGSVSRRLLRRAVRSLCLFYIP